MGHGFEGLFLPVFESINSPLLVTTRLTHSLSDLFAVNNKLVFQVSQNLLYVRDDAKLTLLLECLQQTPPPVLIFAEKKHDVDTIHEYLLLKGTCENVFFKLFVVNCFNVILDLEMYHFVEISRGIGRVVRSSKRLQNILSN